MSDASTALLRRIHKVDRPQSTIYVTHVYQACAQRGGTSDQGENAFGAVDVRGSRSAASDARCGRASGRNARPGRGFVICAWRQTASLPPILRFVERETGRISNRRYT